MIGERVARMVVNLFTLLGEKTTVGGEPVHNTRGAGDFWVELSCNAVCVLLVSLPVCITTLSMTPSRPSSTLLFRVPSTLTQGWVTSTSSTQLILSQASCTSQQETPVEGFFHNYSRCLPPPVLPSKEPLKL